MADRDQIVFMLKMNAQTVAPLIKDITEDESMHRGGRDFNHVRWQTGHLIHSSNVILELLGKDKIEPDEYQRLFDFGTSISENPADYPSMAVLRDELLDVQDYLVEVAGKASDEDLERQVKWFDNPSPVSHLISFMCMHNFYHYGQITHIRKVLGRGRPFD